jgi:hypothetical protein
MSGDVDISNGKSSRFIRRIVIGLAFIIFPLLVMTTFFASANLFAAPVFFQFGGPGKGGNQSVSIVQQGTLTAQEKAVPLGTLPPSFSQSFFGLPNINLGEVVLAVALILVALLIYGTLRVRTVRPGSFENDELSEERLKVAAILDEAAAKLSSGSGYRETVLRCYKMITQVLEKKSSLDGRTLTAREFKIQVIEKLKFDSRYLTQATDLFEVARYSLNEITREEAQTASECLSNLSATLKESVAALGTEGAVIS